jgi:hypothetical protein
MLVIVIILVPVGGIVMVAWSYLPVPGGTIMITKHGYLVREVQLENHKRKNL